MYLSFLHLLHHVGKFHNLLIAVCTLHFYISNTLDVVKVKPIVLYIPFILHPLTPPCDQRRNHAKLYAPFILHSLTPAEQHQSTGRRLYVPFKLTPCREFLGGFVLYAPFNFRPLTPKGFTPFQALCCIYLSFLHSLTPPPALSTSPQSLYAPFIFHTSSPGPQLCPAVCTLHFMPLTLMSSCSGCMHLSFHIL